MATGWQLILRSKNVYGTYEGKIAPAQGTTPTGEDWFLHFQDKGAYGRIVHVQPMTWKNDFPVVGVDRDGNETGEPVLRYKKPNVGKTFAIETPADSDEFNDSKLGLVVMGMDYSYIGATNHKGKLLVSQAAAKDADRGNGETEIASLELKEKSFYLRVKVGKGATCNFSFSTDNKNFTTVGVPFKAREGKWIGAKIGFFFTRPGKFNDAGTADVDWFRFE